MAFAAAAAPFIAAAGEVEFQLDGTTVNTPGGWREMKLGIFARRGPGAKAGAAEWDSCDLPSPTARVAFAAIESIDGFAPRIGVGAGRLGLTDPATITTLGDGAAWIRNAAAEQLPGSGGVSGTFTTPLGTSPTPARGSSARGPRRGPGWRRAGRCCCPTAGRGCATTSGRRW